MITNNKFKIFGQTKAVGYPLEIKLETTTG